MTWSNLQTILEKNTSFLISSHVNQDGDNICSQLAFYWYLESLGKDVVIYNYDPVPVKFAFLKNVDRIVNTRPQRSFDVFIILDSSNTSRLGWDTSKKIAPFIINIDHHRDNAKEGNINIVDPSASSTTEILLRFFNDHAIDFPPYVAEALYTGILTDTGGFQFSNTNSSVLKICADLADKGADCSKIYRNVYSSFRPAGLLLRAKIWSTLTFYNNNRISMMEMPTSLLKESGAGNGDIEGMSDLALTAKGVEVGLFLKYSDKDTHISLRSSGRIDVGRIAQSVPGGGGHTFAAGCTIKLPLKQAKEKMLALIEKELV